MLTVDPNEIFAYLRVCPDEGIVNEIRDVAAQRLDDIQTSRMAPSAKNREFMHVQPTDEVGPAVGRAAPLVGPSTGWNGGSDLNTLAEANQRRETAQRRDLRGPGPVPQTISVGSVGQEHLDEAHAVRTETAEKVQEVARSQAATLAPQVAPAAPVAPVEARVMPRPGPKVGQGVPAAAPTTSGPGQAAPPAQAPAAPTGETAKSAAASSGASTSEPPAGESKQVFNHSGGGGNKP